MALVSHHSLFIHLLFLFNKFHILSLLLSTSTSVIIANLSHLKFSFARRCEAVRESFPDVPGSDVDFLTGCTLHRELGHGVCTWTGTDRVLLQQ